MSNDQILLKNNLMTALLHAFGEELKDNVVELIQKLDGKDSCIDENLILKLQNIVPLSKNIASYMVNLAITLSSTSAISALLFLEKIPTLTFYDIVEEIGCFLLNIKNYGSRAVALFLGSEQTSTLRVEDLVDVLEQSTLPFYKTLLHEVTRRHAEFGVCCAMIMRFAAKTESVIRQEEITDYLDICAAIVSTYGAPIAEQYVRHAHEFMVFFPLKDSLSALKNIAEKSLIQLEFSVSFPKIVFSANSSASKQIIFEQCTDADIKHFKINILEHEDYLTFFNHPALFNDKDYVSLVMNWPNLNAIVKANILFQLKIDHYKNYMLEHDDIQQQRNDIHTVTQGNWLAPWMYCDEVVDLTFIRQKIRALLQEEAQFSLPTKSIIKNHQDVFDRSNPNYDAVRVSNMLDALMRYCVDDETQLALSAMSAFISGNRKPLKELLSTTSLVIQTWDRDPWMDYGRSDEFFSCTSLGDYNSGNAPAFLADMNLNNLDIWSNGIRVGRIRLCLVKDNDNNALLLLDCLDGTERALASQKRFDAIMAAVCSYAQWLGLQNIKINYNVDYNTTPKKFIAYAEQAFGDADRTDFLTRFFTITTTRHLIPYPCQTFLESFVKNTGAFVRGVVIKNEQ